MLILLFYFSIPSMVSPPRSSSTKTVVIYKRTRTRAQPTHRVKETEKGDENVQSN